eukprot:jgi/Chrzof1/9463/Cz04g04020.t1
MLPAGVFPYVKTRAVCKQSSHVRLSSAASQQVLFEFQQQAGHLIGFWTPEYVGSSINAKGFHFHFLSEDKSKGGHCWSVDWIGAQHTSRR